MTGRWALLALVATLLVGCATPPPRHDDVLTASGRLSVSVEASTERAAQGVAAGFELRGTGERGELRLNSPLGTQLASARWAPGLAVLHTPAGGTAFTSLDDLSRQALGEVLPLAALPDWLAGRPWADAAHAETDRGFEQLGWRVDVARRAEGVIEARRAAPPAVTLRVRLDEVAK